LRFTHPFVRKSVLNLSVVYSSHVCISNRFDIMTRQEKPCYIILGIITDGEAHSFPVVCIETVTMEHRVTLARVEGRNIYSTSRNGVVNSLCQ
jgi:hypothetical protein